MLVSQLLLGIVLSAAIAWTGFKKKALSGSGALGAMLVGTGIFAFGGWQWGVLLIVFFATSSGLSFFKDSEKQRVAEKFEKGHRRDIWQTLANGGLATAFAVLNVILPSPVWAIAFAGALATVTADTWATELGVLSRRLPRLITTWQTVEPGFSGGVSLLGTLAAFLGALVIGASAVFLNVIASPALPTILLIGFAGLFGALADSLMGATVQILYRCPRCKSLTEQAAHKSCENIPTEYVRGWRWMNNDAVNFISSIAGAGFAVLFALMVLA